MKKILLLIAGMTFTIIFCFLIYFIISKNNEKDIATVSSSGGTLQSMEDIELILGKEAKASGNKMASILGYGDLMKELASESKEALDKSISVRNQLIEKTDQQVKYESTIEKWKYNFVQESDRIKQIKQDRDLKNLEEALDDLRKLTRDYNKLLDSMLENVK